MAVGHYKDETNGNRHKALARELERHRMDDQGHPDALGSPRRQRPLRRLLHLGQLLRRGRRSRQQETMFGEVHFSSEERTLAEIWNGSEWTVKATTNPEGAKWSSLAAVSCSASTACSAVGANYPGTKGEGNESVPVAERWE
jgi:hypothetical protein